MNDLLDWCVAIYNDKLPQPLVSDFMVPFNIGHSFLRHFWPFIMWDTMYLEFLQPSTSMILAYLKITSDLVPYPLNAVCYEFLSGTMSLHWVFWGFIQAMPFVPGNIHIHILKWQQLHRQCIHSLCSWGKKQRTWELQLLEHRIQTQPGSSKEKEAFNIFKAPLQQAPATFSVAGIKYDDQGNF